MSAAGFVAPLLGALQACVSVLLTMSYGLIARRLRLIQETSINDMGALGVKVFMPALLIINLGKQLHLGSAMNYIPVLGTDAFPKQYLTDTDLSPYSQSGPSHTRSCPLDSATLCRGLLSCRRGLCQHARSTTPRLFRCYCSSPSRAWGASK
jgi:hypothetical protein